MGLTVSDKLQIDIRNLEIDADMPALQRVWREIDGQTVSKPTGRCATFIPRARPGSR